LTGSVSDEMVESMNSSIRQLEMERNQVLSQLKEEQELREDVQNRLQEMQQDLASQTPAVLNGDVINKAQFEALRHAMKQLEEKFSKAMREKADILDKNEQLEHLIGQLQGETDTIGEYVTLYQQQRHILKQRQLEKDDYISHLARDREEMQDKLAQLQALVMQLLGERQMLHSYNEGSNVSEPVANHSPQPPKQKTHRDKSQKLEDWPDYSTDEDSETSEVEAIVGGSDRDAKEHINTADTSMLDTSPSHPNASPEGSSKHVIPPEDQTAHKIMHLLTEIGNSNLVERTSFADVNFLHCSHCMGRLQTV